MQGTWVVLLPPLIVLASAFISRDIIISLVAGIVSAAFIATDFSIIKGALLSIKSCQDQLMDIDNIYLFAFLFVIGIIVSLIGATGGAHAFGKKITKQIKTADGVQKAALSIPFLLFIDDYLNCLTVGHVMHPLTDKFRVPRAKLAFFIDSMTAPLAIITPISSWAGTIISQFELSGITLNADEKPIILADSFYAYLKVIPFTFYSFIIMGTAWFIVCRKISFGTMQKHEQIAEETGNVFGGKPPTKDQTKVLNNNETSIWDMLLPIITLVGLIIITVLYLGNYWLLGGSKSLIEAFQSKYNIFLVLFSASTASLIISLIFAFVRKKLTINIIPSIVINGLKIMWVAVLTVLLAWAFSFLLREHLHTGNYLADILIGRISIIFLPLMLFITASIVSVLTGSSWGAIAIMIPITVPIVLTFLNAQAPIAIEYVGFIFPCLGAVLSGAAAGDHISPISDTTIMSSASSGSYHIDHVRTQFEYSWPAILGTSLSFLISGCLAQNHPILSITVSLIGGIGLTFGILSLLNRKK
jgi:tetracycline resistance efflux pump